MTAKKAHTSKLQWGTHKTYTSTITTPVYASWKCEKCGEINFSYGDICCHRQVSTTSVRESKNKEAKSSSARLVEEAWAEEVYSIISDPNHSALDMRRNFCLQSTKCTKCNRKPRWDKNEYSQLLAIPAIVGTILGVIVIIDNVASVSAWLVFLISLIITVACFAIEPYYKKMMANLPKEYRLSLDLGIRN